MQCVYDNQSTGPTSNLEGLTEDVHITSVVLILWNHCLISIYFLVSTISFSLVMGSLPIREVNSLYKVIHVSVACDLKVTTGQVRRFLGWPPGAVDVLWSHSPDLSARFVQCGGRRTQEGKNNDGVEKTFDEHHHRHAPAPTLLRATFQSNKV